MAAGDFRDLVAPQEMISLAININIRSGIAQEVESGGCLYTGGY